MAKETIEFTYRGKSLEELKQLSLEEFATLIPSRVRRKVTRGLTEQEQILLKKFRAGEKNIKTHCRNMVILPEFVGHTLQVYNGKAFTPIKIVEEMIGYRLGEFALTRKTVKHADIKPNKKSQIRK